MCLFSFNVPRVSSSPKEFQWCFKAVKGYLKFKGSLKDVLRKFKGRFKEVFRMSQGSFREMSMVFQESFKGVSSKIGGHFK